MILGHLASFCACVIAFVLLTLGCAGNNWITQTVGDQEASMGLWKACFVHVCKEFSTDGHSFYDSCKALSTLAVIVSGVAMLGYVINWYSPDSTIGMLGGIPYISSGLLFISGSLMAGAARVYGSNIFDQFSIIEFGWSYFMAYASAAFCYLVTAATAISYKCAYDRCCANEYQAI
uniref:Uncharacterized protein n=1 Tax=Clytia hemisphaerica TaxID=252671 RepID=A0A7M5VGU3_9CNID